MGLMPILLVGMQLFASAAGAAGERQWCRLLGKSDDLSQVYECQGVSPLLLLPYLWSPLTVTVLCSRVHGLCLRSVTPLMSSHLGLTLFSVSVFGIKSPAAPAGHQQPLCSSHGANYQPRLNPSSATSPILLQLQLLWSEPPAGRTASSACSP